MSASNGTIDLEKITLTQKQIDAIEFLLGAAKTLSNCYSDDSDDYPDSSSFRQVQDNVIRVQEAIKEVKKNLPNITPQY